MSRIFAITVVVFSQSKPELAAFTKLALDSNFAAMLFDDHGIFFAPAYAIVAGTLTVHKVKNN